MNTPEQFWSHVERADSISCWNWNAGIQRGGYGWLRWQNYPAFAHRVAWVLSHGPIGKSLVVCHHCDNRLCCNPSHLLVGTHQENVEDRVFKNRSASGEQNGSARLTWPQVDAIRQSYDSGSSTVNQLVQEYGVAQFTIQQIVNRRRWLRS